jgi:hypothetical protein
VPPDYQRLIYEQLAGPVGSDGHGHGLPQLGNLTIVDYLAKYKPALDALLAQAGGPAKTAAPRIVIPAADKPVASKAAMSAKKAPARKNSAPAAKAAVRKTTPRKG